MPILNFSGLFKKNPRSNNKGFTLFEVLVVVGIIAVLSTILIGYSRQGNSALLMTSTHTKLENMISRAKFLSIQTYFDAQDDEDEVVCAHGVHIDTDGQEAFVFQKIGDKAFGCSDDIDDYEGFSPGDVRLSGELSNVNLESLIVHIADEDEGTTLEYVIFLPPDPLVRINDSRDKSASVIVTDGRTQLTVTVDDQGQIKRE